MRLVVNTPRQTFNSGQSCSLAFSVGLQAASVTQDAMPFCVGCGGNSFLTMQSRRFPFWVLDSAVCGA